MPRATRRRARHHRADPRRRAEPAAADGLDGLHRTRADQPERRGPGPRDRRAGNLATTPQTLTNWRLLDKNGRVTPIDATLAPGASLLVALDGTGVQLGNNGGNLILQDDTNAQVDVVTYTAEDAASDNRYVRFRR